MSRQSEQSNISRRSVIQTVGASTFASTIPLGKAAATAGKTYILEQGDDTHELEPLSYEGWTAEQFYSYGSPDGASANTPTDLEKSQTSRLFLYEGPNGLSLVVIHDKPNNGSGGSAEFRFSGLSPDGSWVVPDDGGDGLNHQYGNWVWYRCCTDGGVFHGGLNDKFQFTIEPAFYRGIDSWEVLSGNSENPDVISLDPDAPISIRTRGSEEIDAQEQINNKKELITSIRSAAAPLNLTRGPEEIDAVAADFIEDLENDLSNTSREQQIAEVANRLVLGEAVTETSVKQGKKPAFKAGHAGVELIISFAVSYAVGKIGTRAVGSKWLKTQYEEIATLLQNLRDVLIGRGRFPRKLAREFDEFATSLSDEAETLITENKEDLTSIGSSLTAKGIESFGSIVADSDVGQGLNDVRKGADRSLASLLYTTYINKDVPEEEEGGPIGNEGIDTRIDETTDRLREQYSNGNVSQTGRARRQEVSQKLQRLIRDDTEKVVDKYDDVNDALGPLAGAEAVVGVAAIILFAAEALTSLSSFISSGGKLAKAGKKLATVAGILGTAYTATLAGEVAFGWEYLDATQSTHWQIDRILNYELSVQ